MLETPFPGRWGYDRLAIAALLALLTGLLLLTAFRSLHERIGHDSPIMFYLAFLIDRFHFVPYRDTVDMNMPGSYLLYVLIGRAAGYQDFGLRIADLCLLTSLGAATWFVLRKFGALSAWAASVLFSLAYLVQGNAYGLQREYLILVLVGAALALLFHQKEAAEPRGKSLVWDGVIGLLLGICVTIKPPVALLWPLFPLFRVRGLMPGASAAARRSIWLASACGLLLPVIAMVGYLVLSHTLTLFLDFARNYWPLYAKFDGNEEVLTGTRRLRYVVVHMLKFCSDAPWVPTAVLGVWIAARFGALPPEQRRQVKMLVALFLFFWIYPAFSGQFYNHHGLPLLYFAVLLTSLCFVPLVPSAAPRGLLAARVAVMAGLLLTVGSTAWKFRPETRPAGGLADEIATYLTGHLRPGDRVQPLDWIGGTVHAMLISRARIATPFVYDFYFYHDVSNPYIQGLRRRFIRDLNAAHPRFIVEIIGDGHPWPSGKGTTRQFPELQAILAAQYHPVQAQHGYIIFERDSPHGKN